MKACLFVLLALVPAASAQTNSFSVYAQPAFDSLREGVEAAAQARRADLEQQRVDIERERLHFEERQAASVMRREAPENLSYRDVHPHEAQWRINQDVKDAMAACNQAHPDCAKLDGMMEIVAKAVRPDWTQLSMAEYVECLYAIARNATFAEHARQMLSAPTVAAKQ